MAVRFLAREVSDLCLGKPALTALPASSATVADALSALKRSGESHVSVWACCENNHDHSDLCSPAAKAGGECRCVGKICMVDVICFLSREKNLVDPSAALRAPVSDLLDKAGAGIVRHLEPHSSLLEAIDYILDGAQNLIVPIETRTTTFTSRKKHLTKSSSFGSTLHNGREFCWLTQEDVVRFLLNSIGIFSPIPAFTIESLNIIETNIMSIYYDDPASSALDSISLSLTEQKSIAVVDEDNKLIGEISPYTLCCCDETAAAAISTLSAGDLMAYLDYSGPPEDLVNLVKERLEEKNLGAILELMEELSYSSSLSSSSSDEEFGLVRGGGLGRNFPARRSETIICRRWSSLVAVMIQALAHRVSHVWVVEEDYSIVGIVTFAGILNVFRSIAGVRKA
ncbi:CBS domain-containing protein CBSX5-like [Rhododendron vialii]|uniref:CBS domain-containing protein CBSX5-like n=1 Tax=Rhododendron vialii TaxID=182163 RepID=UPI002660139E|nr:CBS domain-containing protein CBSX5-like [Rhododendron vialii]